MSSAAFGLAGVIFGALITSGSVWLRDRFSRRVAVSAAARHMIEATIETERAVQRARGADLPLDESRFVSFHQRWVEYRDALAPALAYDDWITVTDAIEATLVFEDLFALNGQVATALSRRSLGRDLLKSLKKARKTFIRYA